MASSGRAFLCECGDRRCHAEARLTDADYAELARRGLKLIARPAHAVPTGIVVASGPGWVAVGRRRRVVDEAAAKPKPAKPQLEPEIRRCPSCDVEVITSPTGHCHWCGTLILEAA